MVDSFDSDAYWEAESHPLLILVVPLVLLEKWQHTMSRMTTTVEPR